MTTVNLEVKFSKNWIQSKPQFDAPSKIEQRKNSYNWRLLHWLLDNNCQIIFSYLGIIFQLIDIQVFLFNKEVWLLLDATFTQGHIQFVFINNADCSTQQ